MSNATSSTISPRCGACRDGSHRSRNAGNGSIDRDHRFLTAERASCGLEKPAEPPMKRKLPAALGLVLGLVGLAGCVQPQPPQPCVAVAAAALPVVAAAVIPAPPAPEWAPPRHHVATTAHPPHVVVHHTVRRRISYTRVWTPRCGSVVHPCTVEHLAAPIQ